MVARLQDHHFQSFLHFIVQTQFSLSVNDVPVNKRINSANVVL